MQGLQKEKVGKKVGTFLLFMYICIGNNINSYFIMKPNRLDDVFQLIGGVPIIAGFYIGMEEEKAKELLEELTSYRTEHCYDYPADFIYKYKLLFQFSLFPESDKVNSITVIFPKINACQIFDNLKEYFSEKFFHVETKENIEKDEDNNIIGFEIELFEYFYQYSLKSKDNKLFVEIKAKLEFDEMYCAINTISQDSNLLDFIMKSMLLCKDFDRNHRDFAMVMPFHYGLPELLDYRLGFEGLVREDCGWLDELEDITYKGNPVCEDYDIRYEVTLGYYDCVNSIILCIPHDSEGLWKLVQYIRENFLIEENNLKIEYDHLGYFRSIKGDIRNKYISIEFNCPYYATNEGVYITIKAIDEEHPEIYRALYTIFEKETIFSFFLGVKKFCQYSNPTQDAKFNELRKKYNSFQEALDDYTGEHEAWARDMGGYSKEEYEHDRAMCLDAWNCVGGKGFPRSWIDVGIK